MRGDGPGGVRLPRRAVLGAGVAGGVPGLAAAARRAHAPIFADAEFDAVLRTYASFGDKAAGGRGDEASGAWVEAQLTSAGFACERQEFEAPAFDAVDTSLTSGDARALVVPQSIVIATPAGGLTRPLRLASQPGHPDVGGALAVVVLPYRRWSSAKDPAVTAAVGAALGAGAAGVILVTTGPTGEALALNAPASQPLFDRPVAVLAPRDAGPFLAAAAAGRNGTLIIAGHGYRRPAFNVIGRLRRGGRRTLVISTPRSGWFSCVGERGPGLAVWLALSRWAARSPLGVDVEVLCTSGHEYENTGGIHYIEGLAPKPERVALWVHLGANVAARDWHELGALTPLPSADPQRILMGSSELIPRLRKAFAGQPGLEQPYPAQRGGAAGELTHVLKAGYAPAVGIFGGHRFHHSANDDLRCISPPLARIVAEAFASVIEETLTSDA